MAQQPSDLDPSASPRALFGFQLRRLREARRLSQSEVGSIVFVSGDSVNKYETGRALPPTRDAAERLDNGLGGLGLLVGAWMLAKRTDRRTGRYAESDAEHAETAVAPVQIARRTGNMAGVESLDPIAAAGARAADFGRWVERVDSGHVTVEVLYQRVRALAADCLTMPAAATAMQAADLASDVFNLIQQGHHRPGHARDLYTVAAAVASLMAWLSGDLGQLDVAGVHAGTARACAEMSGDPTTQAWAMVAASKTRFWRHDYRGAADDASQGAGFAAAGTAGVMLACQYADALSFLGGGREATAALRAAQDAAESIRGVDSVGGLFSCRAVRMLNYTAGVRLELGHTREALADADLALEQVAAESVGYGTVGQIHITRALAYLKTDSVEGAAAALEPLLAIPPALRLTTLTDRLALIAGTLTQSSRLRGRDAAALAEEITVFCELDAGAPAISTALWSKEQI